jgi:hypothetical protein
MPIGFADVTDRVGGVGGTLWTAGLVTNIYDSLDQRGVTVMDPQFGAVGDGTTDDRDAFVAAMAASPLVRVPYTASGYKIGSAMTIPADTRLVGIGPRAAQLLHAFNGNFLTLSDGAILEHLWIDGQGATYTGKGLLFTGSDGHQKLLHCQVTDFADYCLDFETNAGSLFYAADCELWQTDGLTAGKYAVNISNTQQLSAKPRKFVGIETGGKKFINFGGCNNVFVAASFVGELAYTADTRAALVVGSRVGVNETAMTVNGAGNTITGCDVAPALTIASGATNCIVGPNVYNTSPYVTDSSANGLNEVYVRSQAYTPTLTSGGTAPSLGDGTLTGFWSRQGRVVTFTALLTVGSTTSFGTGDIRISVPIASVQSVQVGTAYATDGGTNYVLAAVLAASNTYVNFRINAGGSASVTIPFTWATGDTLRVTMSYSV